MQANSVGAGSWHGIRQLTRVAAKHPEILEDLREGEELPSDPELDKCIARAREEERQAMDC